MAYNDSRQAAIRLYRKLRLGWIFNTSTFAGNFLLAMLIGYFFRELGYQDDVNYVFFLSVLAIGLWVTEAIPPFAVGIFIIAGLLLGFGTDFILEEHKTPVEMYLGTWTSNVIWLLLGGFFLAEAMSQVGLDKALFRYTLKKFGTQPERLLMGLMLTTAIGSMVMSNTATTAMMISSVLPLAHMMGKNSAYTKALLIGIPAAATLGGMGTIIGSTPNAIAVGALQEKGINITFIEWMIFGLPTALLATYIFWKFLIRKLKLKTLTLDFDKLSQEPSPSIKFEKNAVIFTLIITISAWLTEPIHHIPIAATSAIPIVLLTLFQVIKAEDVRRLPWDTLMLVAGGLALGIAMVDVGLTDIIMEKIELLPIPLFGVGVVFAIIAVLISNIMSNTAASSILVPLGLALPGIWGFAVPLIVALSCSCALLLPVSTPSNAISFSTGMIEQKSFRSGGLLMIVLGPILAFVAVMIYALIFGA
ncbi:solute carrier family 13 (sodium-dependent dicarboxylate transporter), member 2/3/5 [Belliella buryatensis]|uniref:Solute carrier family 13 (Sodium-dependent dicarboxylate transporter), member 2/3/5 n=1 Tax=Belliella buryatensis TaxID=1500549 RepID=A0A239B9W6_9BACT|nr:DASS family sodium-coupled anion symporter [Belliella buryatensis]SNS04311.1 solute carrier family 13 (sodium-dependent dicarboxylate transporter), member 2/3/5 [Belliella buryatensis]